MKIILSLLIPLFLILAGSAFAEPSSVKPKLKYGDKVRFAKCGDPNQQYWVSDGYPMAHREDLKWCGMRGVIVTEPGRACDPWEGKMCDPWSYTVRINKTKKEVRATEAELGLKKRKGNTMMDMVCSEKQKKCSL